MRGSPGIGPFLLVLGACGVTPEQAPATDTSDAGTSDGASDQWVYEGLDIYLGSSAPFELVVPLPTNDRVGFDNWLGRLARAPLSTTATLSDTPTERGRGLRVSGAGDVILSAGLSYPPSDDYQDGEWSMPAAPSGDLEMLLPVKLEQGEVTVLIEYRAFDSGGCGRSGSFFRTSTVAGWEEIRGYDYVVCQ